jgi:hypothetical protein
MHNEQIAAQLTIAYTNAWAGFVKPYGELIEDTYKDFLKKLNKGEI